MERWLGRYSEQAYALMRIMMGLLFAQHGAQKLFGQRTVDVRGFFGESDLRCISLLAGLGGVWLVVSRARGAS